MTTTEQSADPRPHVSPGEYVRIDFTWHNNTRHHIGKVGRVLEVSDPIPGLLVDVDGERVLVTRWSRAAATSAAVAAPLPARPLPQHIEGRPEPEGVRQPYVRGRALGVVLDVLRLVALVLSIIVLAAVVYGGARLLSAAGDLRDSLNNVGDTSTSQTVDPVPDGDTAGLPDECWNPGGGEVCAPGGADGLPGGE